MEVAPLNVATTPDRGVVDPLRHILYFNPDVFGHRRVDVIGCGAVGSRIATEVARLGVTNLHLWDFDIVESHNVANQIFGLNDIGMLKTEAARQRIVGDTGIRPDIHTTHVRAGEELGEVVFLAVDTMTARKEIFDTCLRNRFSTKVVIESRMSAEEFRVYGFNPCSRSEIIEWENSLYDDEVTVENACRVQSTVGATAAITAGFAVQRFLQWYRWEVVRDKAVTIRPPIEQGLMMWPLVAYAK